MIYQKYTGENELKNIGGKNLLLSKDEVIKEQQEEIERLNKIIIELEKYLKEFTPMAEFGTNRTYIPNDIVLDKLKELKGK